MSAIILALILTAIFFIAAQLMWYLLFCHLFQMKRELTFNIREAIFPDVHKTINLLTSLAAAAIVLTFSILKILKTPNILYKSYLITSWISFTFTILFGVAAMIMIYILRAQYMITIRNFEKADKDRTPEVIDGLGSFLNKARGIERAFHIFLYCQAVTFVSAIIYLVIFTIINF